MSFNEKMFFHSYKGLFALLLLKDMKFAKERLKTSVATKLGFPRFAKHET
jgi:hypothetical protein